MSKEWKTEFDRVFEVFEKEFPIDLVFDKVKGSHSGLLRIYEYREMVRRNDLLEKIWRRLQKMGG